MSASLNKVLLIGNLTREPELRYIPSGQGVTSFTIAVNRKYNGQNGEKKEDTTFVRIVAWGRLAEICNEYLNKGSSVCVEGRLQSRSWEAQDGSKRNTIEVIAQNVQFLGRASGGAPATRVEPKAQTAPVEKVIEDSFDGMPSNLSVPVTESDFGPNEEIPF